MISINKQGNAIVIEFTDNDKYLFNGTIEVAPNELMIVIDESNMATFKRSTNGDTLFSQLINKIQIGGTNVTKDTILDEFAKVGFATVNWLEITGKPTTFSDWDATEGEQVIANKPDLSQYATNVELNHVKSELANKADTSSLNGKVDKVEGKSLISDSEITRLATLTNYDDTEVKNLIATKANSADVYTKTESDAKYLTEHQSLADYATKEELSLKANSSDIPTKTSQLVNDSGYLTEHQSLADYATKSEIPTATSQLTNDSGFITEIPSEYITETELTSSLSTKADSANVYTKTEIDNMIGDISARLDQINGEVI